MEVQTNQNSKNGATLQRVESIVPDNSFCGFLGRSFFATRIAAIADMSSIKISRWVAQHAKTSQPTQGRNICGTLIVPSARW